MTDPVTQTPDIVAELVGEGKKFKTVADLAASVKEKDAFIPKLQDENRELRSLLKTVEAQDSRLATMAEILEKVKGNLSSPGADPLARTNGSAPTTSSGTDNQNSGMTRDDVKKLFDEVERERREEGNKRFANKRLHEVYGDKANETLVEKSVALGVSLEQMQELAKQSPGAFLTMLGIPRDATTPKSNPVPSTGNLSTTRSSVNTDALGISGNQSDVRNKAYYDKVKEGMGATKFIMNQKIQLQLHKDMAVLGDRFFS